MKAATRARLQREAAEWNALYPVGTPVEFWLGRRGDGPPLRGHTIYPADRICDHVSVRVRRCGGETLSMNVSHVQPLTRLKCKTLHQPYASAMAWGLKTIETNGYPAERYGLRPGDLLAIHAAKRPMDHAALRLVEDLGVVHTLFPPGGRGPIYSAVLCVVRYLGCRTTGDLLYSPHRPLSHIERALGNYTPGRFGWRCELVKRFDEPIPAKGAQGIWRWSVPAVSRWWEGAR